MMYDPVQYLKAATGASSLCLAIEEEVRAARLASGDALPPVRSLAQRLGLAPATVAAAYRELGRRGLVAAAGRKGTRIAARPPLAVSLPPSEDVAAEHLRNLADGNPDPSWLPDLSRALSRLPGRPRLYGEPECLPELAERARELLSADGVEVPALTIVGGAMDGVERALQAHLHPGDRVAVEDPGYPGVLDLVGALGLTPEPVELDATGARPESLERALRRRASAFVLTPRAQNPTGAALDEKRSRELRRVLSHFPACLVVEDDHAGPVAGAPLHSISRGRERFAHVRSLSKSLGPDLRLAFLAGDPTTVARVEGRRQLGSGWVSRVLQSLALDLLTDASVEKLLQRAGAAYRLNREGLCSALRKQGLPALGWSGLNVWVPASEEARPLSALASAGYAVRAGERYRLRSQPGLRVTVSRLQPAEAPALALEMARALLAPASRSQP